MNCLVCNHDFNEDDICPRCKFPVTFYTGDSEEEFAEEMARANRFKSDILKNIAVKVHSYEYSVEDGEIKNQKHDVYSLGDGEHLIQEAVWLPTKITNLSYASLNKVDAEIEFTVKGAAKKCKVTLNAESGNGDYSFGVYVDEEIYLHLVLRDNEKQLDDQKIDVFA